MSIAENVGPDFNRFPGDALDGKFPIIDAGIDVLYEVARRRQLWFPHGKGRERAWSCLNIHDDPIQQRRSAAECSHFKLTHSLITTRARFDNWRASCLVP
jgi:hypothetical protein